MITSSLIKKEKGRDEKREGEIERKRLREGKEGRKKDFLEIHSGKSLGWSVRERVRPKECTYGPFSHHKLLDTD